MNANVQTDLHIFERIVCGIDGTPESLFAAKQASRLLRPEGSLLLVVAMGLAKAAHAGMAARHAAELLQDEAEQAMAEAKELVPAEGKIVNGDPATALLSEAQRATLLALGSHGRRRAAGILLGTVAARMLHEAPCPVLIARPARDPDTLAPGDRRGRGRVGRIGARGCRGPLRRELVPGRTTHRVRNERSGRSRRCAESRA